ncbi:MAG: RraA family protein [Chloroflexi bacterium]|nr:RraA family protein [Chloroflexota bacterium]
MDRLGLDGAVLGLRPMWACPRIAGQVIPVRLRRARPGERSERHLGTAAIESGGPGRVIVIQHREHDQAAGWGGILSLAARARGVEGVIVDGLCRDVDDSREVGCPVYARGATPMTARGRVVEASSGEPINVGALRVNPGDYVIADWSGVVFIRADVAERVIETAEALATREAQMAEAVRSGRSVIEVMGATYESMLGEAT